MAATDASMDTIKSRIDIPEKPRNLEGVLNSCRPRSFIALCLETVVGTLIKIDGDIGSVGEVDGSLRYELWLGDSSRGGW